MTKELFEKLKKEAQYEGKLKLSDLGEHNINVLKHRIANDFRLAIDEFNFYGNSYKNNKQAKQYIVHLLRCNALTEDEWNKLLPHIKVFDFNNEYDEAMEKLTPLITRLVKNYWFKDLRLEFWQGGLSGDSHWCNPENKVNRRENGEEYIKIIQDMYKILEPMYKKWNCSYTFMERICDEPSNYGFTWN